MSRKNTSGFTMFELVIVIAIIGILAGIAIPAFLEWLPGYRLRRASRDLYNNMQLVKLRAIQQNKKWTLVFDEAAHNYKLCINDGASCDKTVSFTDYGSGVDFGLSKDGSGDIVTYPGKKANFETRGTGQLGWVYIVNNRGGSWRVGSLLSGVVRMDMWNGTAYE